MFGYRFHSRARNPLVRLLALIAGGAVVVLFNALRTPQRAAPAPPSAQTPAGVIEGEFKVVRETTAHR